VSKGSFFGPNPGLSTGAWAAAAESPGWLSPPGSDFCGCKLLHKLKLCMASEGDEEAAFKTALL